MLRDQLSPDKLAEIRGVLRKTDAEVGALLAERAARGAPAGPGDVRLAGLLAPRGPDHLTSLYMRLLVDEFSNLKPYPGLHSPECAIVGVARAAQYVTRPRAPAVLHIQEVWPGCEVREVGGGHVTSYLAHQPAFRRAIHDAFLRLDQVLERGQGRGEGC